MKQADRWIVAIVVAVISVMTSALIAASSSATYGAVLANGTLTPTAWVYLPYVSKEELPTLTPTTVPSGVHILSNHSSYVDSSDYLHIAGEVQNSTANHLQLVKISVNIYNSSDDFIDTDYTYTKLDNLPAGYKTCFHILLEEPAGWSYYQFETPTYWTGGKPLPNLTVLNHSGSYNPTSGKYVIIGQVRNDHGTRVESVSPVGTLYNDSGLVVGCGSTWVNSTHLDPGQISSFKITFYGHHYADVTSYRLQVDGYPQ